MNDIDPETQLPIRLVNEVAAAKRAQKDAQNALYAANARLVDTDRDTRNWFTQNPDLVAKRTATV